MTTETQNDYTVTEAQLEVFNNALGLASTGDNKSVNGKRSKDIINAKAAIAKAVTAMDTVVASVLELDLENSDRDTNIAKFDLLRKPDTKRPSNQHAAVYAWGRELVLKSIFTPELYDAVTTGVVDADTVIGGHPTMKDRKKSAWQVEFGSRYKKAVDRISGRILPEEKDIAYNTAQIKKLLATMDTKMHGKKSVGFKSKNNKQATAAWKVLNSYFA